ncbi:unnamed protein product [Cyprideis torosa]|uniref:Uncharacterized protein n=1 Tax=Cyprideis torosa TaxID=163714 RepID=A0A7R8WCN8_9CRUS|nr:unnamed protein product [Cyprideis torosa]CAG0888152.1 unnamed protein product [Cyprideis torosa]
MPSISSEIRFGNLLCDVWVAFDVLCCTASILNLCMISVDRYFAITKPLEYGVKRTPARMFFYITIVWAGSALICIPPLVILGGNEHDNSQCIVNQNFWYQIYATFGSFYIPLTVMVMVYARIFKAAKRITDEEKRSQFNLGTKTPLKTNASDHLEMDNNHQRSECSETLCPNGNGRGGRGSGGSSFGPENVHLNPPGRDADARKFSVGSRRYAARVGYNLWTRTGRLKHFLSLESKASSTLGIIMSAFVICWLPFFVLALVRPFTRVPDALSSIFLWLGYANSTLNPVIYATLNKDFRTPFREILCLRCRSLEIMMREEFYQFQYGGPDLSSATAERRAVSRTPVHEYVTTDL